MKITILGSGSCYGVPTVGNDWGRCDPSNPKNNRTVASILIEQDGTKILVDMSPDFREQSIRHDVKDLDAILFTHGHADHILGHFYLPRLMQYYKGKDIPLYADPVAQKEIEQMFHFQTNREGGLTFSYGGETHWETIEPFKQFSTGNLQIMPLPQEHGDIASFGFRIGNFAYCTDFNDFPQESWDRLQGLDCWIIECNRKDKTDNSEKHMYLEKALAFIDKIKPKKTYLTHLGNTFDYNSVSAELPENVFLAYDGLELHL